VQNRAWGVVNGVAKRDEGGLTSFGDIQKPRCTVTLFRGFSVSTTWLRQ